MADIADDVIIVTSSLTKDMTGKVLFVLHKLHVVITHLINC